jgi:hypothetical protein
MKLHHYLLSVIFCPPQRAGSSLVVLSLGQLKGSRQARKNIIESVDHILSHDLVCENPLAAKFVSDMEHEVQNIKEQFNSTMLSIVGSRNGQDNEFCFPLFKNNK